VDTMRKRPISWPGEGLLSAKTHHSFAHQERQLRLQSAPTFLPPKNGEEGKKCLNCASGPKPQRTGQRQPALQSKQSPRSVPAFRAQAMARQYWPAKCQIRPAKRGLPATHQGPKWATRPDPGHE